MRKIVAVSVLKSLTPGNSTRRPSTSTALLRTFTGHPRHCGTRDRLRSPRHHPRSPMASSTSAKIIYWSYATNAILQIVDVVAWLHPPLLCPQAREPVAQMFVRAQSVMLAPLLMVFWLFRSVPLQGEHDAATRTLSGIARGVAVSFVVFHLATIVWCAVEVYVLGTEMTKTLLIFCFHGFYTIAVLCAYRLSQLEVKRNVN